MKPRMPKPNPLKQGYQDQQVQEVQQSIESVKISRGQNSKPNLKVVRQQEKPEQSLFTQEEENDLLDTKSKNNRMRPNKPTYNQGNDSQDEQKPKNVNNIYNKLLKPDLKKKLNNPINNSPNFEESQEDSQFQGRQRPPTPQKDGKQLIKNPQEDLDFRKTTSKPFQNKGNQGVRPAPQQPEQINTREKQQLAEILGAESDLIQGPSKNLFKKKVEVEAKITIKQKISAKQSEDEAPSEYDNDFEDFEPEIVTEEKAKPKMMINKSKQIDWSKVPVNQSIEVERNTSQLQQNQNKIILKPGQSKYSKMPITSTIDYTDSGYNEDPVVPQNKSKIVQQQFIEKQQVKRINEDYEYEQQDVRGINLAPTHYIQVSDRVIDKQTERCRQLLEILQLETEQFDDQFELTSKNEYEVYMNKIKSSVIKNSCDNCSRQTESIEIQTDEILVNNTGNQAPEDYSRTFLDNQVKVIQNNELKNINDAKNLIDFMNNTFPIFEEIFSIEKKNTKDQNISDDKPRPYIMQNLIKNKFKISSIGLVYQDPNDTTNTFITYNISSEKEHWFKVSLIVQYNSFEGVRYFITPSFITCLLFINSNLIAGTKEGSLVFYDVRESDFMHQKNCNKYIDFMVQTLEEDLENGLDFAIRYPSFTSEYISATQNIQFDLGGGFQDHQHRSQIIKILHNKNHTGLTEIFSLEEFGKIIQWDIIELSKQEQDRSFIDFGFHSKIRVTSPGELNLQNIIPGYMDTLCSDVDIDSDNNLFVSSGAGIIKSDIHGSIKMKPPREYLEQYLSSMATCVVCGQNIDLIIAGYSEGSVKLFSKQFGQPLLVITGFTKKKILNIFVPRVHNPENLVQFQDDFTRFMVVDSDNTLYCFNLNKNKQNPIEKIQKKLNENVLFSIQNVKSQDMLAFIFKNKNENQVIYWSYKKFLQNEYDIVKQESRILEQELITHFHSFMS